MPGAAAVLILAAAVLLCAGIIGCIANAIMISRASKLLSATSQRVVSAAATPIIIRPTNPTEGDTHA